MREIDRLTTERFGVPSLLLMETAANASAQSISEAFSHDLSRKTALVLCGRGNNGGDGAALARILSTRGVEVDVLLFGRVEDSTGDALTNFQIVQKLSGFDAGTRERPSPLSFMECDTVQAWEGLASARRDYDIIVDALFGTGLKRPLEGIHRAVVDHLTLLREARERGRETTPLFVSLDIPSGLDADSATPIGPAVCADLTVTFTAPKPANILPPAAHFCGRLVVAEIGSPPALLDGASSQLFISEERDARHWLEQTRYLPGSYKNTHGHVLVIAGSRRFTGASVLCADGAMRAGTGLVTAATPVSALPSVSARVMPEVMTAALPETSRGAISADALDAVSELAERSDVIAVGPGLTSDDESTRRLVREVVERRRRPVVIDADGLNSLAPWPDDLQGSQAAPLILTPHEGEMRRLLGLSRVEGTADRLDSDRVGVVRDFAQKHQLIVVLKGTRTMIAAPDGRVVVSPTGNPGLGTAGAGDTLTGIIAGFNAQAFATLKEEADAVSATIAAVFIGGMAGDYAARARGMRAMVASDIREQIGPAIRALDPKGEEP